MTAPPAPAQADAGPAPWPAIWAGGIAIAAVAITATTTIHEPMLYVSPIALFVFLGLFPAYFITYLASRARRAHNRLLTGKWLLLWAWSRVAFLVAVPILAAACAVAWAAGTAIAGPLLEALILTLIVSAALGIAGNSVINLIRVISGPEPTK